jgi:hypothetical protein
VEDMLKQLGPEHKERAREVCEQLADEGKLQRFGGSGSRTQYGATEAGRIAVQGGGPHLGGWCASA